MICGHRPQLSSLWRTCAFCVAALAVLVTAGCGHKQPVAYTPPPAPPVAAAPAPPSVAVTPLPPGTGKPGAGLSVDEEFVATHAPVFTETGVASWYGPPYHNRVGADGTVFDQNHVSAAHRTLPMGSLIRVTNLRTGQSAVMRVTDRGPFVEGRVLDLSVAAAKEVGVWRGGTGDVRIDVYSTPKPMDVGGRWCVQIGAFSHAGSALRLQTQLERQYRTANVIEFQGPTGYWVRIRPANDDRTVAMDIAHRLRPAEGDAWLVRLD
jgi:rare lipoprotein A